jgi:arabinogalactan oligomer / maltooligosaccharide transport system permease protein
METLVAPKILTGNPLTVVLKVIVVGLVLSLLGTLAISALAVGEFFIAAFIFFAMLALGITYLTKISVPMKFFLPGMLLLFAFVVAPIVYTVSMSVFQYQTGNYISKSEAVKIISDQGVAQDELGTAYDVKIGRGPSGDLQLLVSDIFEERYYLSSLTSYTELDPESVTVDEFLVANSAPGFELMPDEELAEIGEELGLFRFFFNEPFFLTLQGFEVAAVYEQSLVFDTVNDQFQNLQTRDVYADNGRGNYSNLSDPGDILIPGWRSPVWFENYAKLVTDPQVREPFLAVFVWTVAFASITVLMQFAFGLVLALALDKKIRGRRFYRTVLILPYAIPSIMSILIWGGMFDAEFGAINALLGTDIAWLRDGNFAKMAVLLVNLWLGFPYFYLVSSGALQAIPSDLSEAASIDGAGPLQVFRMITLPLLLKILTPLLIASFAFNFNNFNLIFLLTGGGPRNDLEGEVAGATDILISYTYRIAFGSDVQNLGLASAISVVIFILVAVISLYGIRRSKVLDEFL